MVGQPYPSEWCRSSKTNAIEQEVPMSDEPQAPKEEHYAFNMWDDPVFTSIIDRYKSHRKDLQGLAEEPEQGGYKSDKDVPPHIRNWFENPIYQLLIKPSREEVEKLFKFSKRLTIITFFIGVGLLVAGTILAFCSQPKDIAAISLLVSGVAGILASLYKGAANLKDIAVEYTKLQVAISAGMVSLDALQRIVGHQERLTKDELDAVRGITDALAPIIRSIKDNPAQD
jgi:hypothetical protein